MINHKEADILAYLIKRSPLNTYVVLEPEEIIDHMTEKVDKDELLSLLTDLSGRSAIETRIINLQECVVAPTPKAPVLIEELKEMESTKAMINSVKNTVNAVEEEFNEPTPQAKERKTFKKTPQEKIITTKVEINYKKIFWSAFTGAMSGGGIIAIIMLIIGLVG